MKVEIWSDVICPWCYIGKARFDKALAAFPQRDRIEWEWKPYQLDPNAPFTPTPAIDGYAKKFGGPEAAKQIIARVTEAAAGDGIEFRMDRALRANTFDAHRCIWLALQLGGAPLQDAMKRRLDEAYFTDGLNVADHDQLGDLAAEVGMDRARVLQMLDSDEGMAETRRELLLGQEMGITAVPSFVFAGKWMIPGAQDPEVFVRVFEKLLAQEEADRAAAEAIASGAACSIDDPNC